MADNRDEEAVDIVARHVIARAAEDFAEDGWDLYEEIGEHDWHEVADRAITFAPYPDREQYQAAYDYLAGRADAM